MSCRARFFPHWLPVLTWAGFIFWGSTDVLSGAHTSRFLRPVLEWLLPDPGADAFEQIQLAVRKAGHVTEYAVLTALLWRALNGPGLGQTRPWPRRLAWLAWSLAVAYAASDEFHQTFIPSREGSLRDVGIDALGAALALGLIWWRGRCRHRWAGLARSSGVRH
ncbi:MAG TPA: VanZ family protein [Candidatus Limnocylindria bacterium]|jgi:VanZ family protein|nr:VanZ family protein [Candidatus Limnocylindria bacterium]